MRSKRREFIRSAGMIGASMALASKTDAIPTLFAGPKRGLNKMAPKKILILGGTGFIGPNMVKYAVERGNEVTIFSRGNRKSETAGVEHLVGDRNNDLSALKGRKWDVVIDNNTFDYRWVQLSTEVLKDSVDHYIFVSSISAYNSQYEGYKHKDRLLYEPIIHEEYETLKPTGDWKDGDKAPYGLTKALSENMAHKVFPGRTTLVRPGLIVGPGDKSKRWTYWPVRIAEGGEVLIPGNPKHSNQVIDQRDLTEWIVRLAENGTMGNFNGVGPGTRMSMAQMIYAIWAGVGGSATFTWVDEDFLESEGVDPPISSGSLFPSWVPGSAKKYCANQNSVEAGLTFRPMGITAADTLKWEAERPKEDQINDRAISRKQENELLAAWSREKK